MKRNLFRNIVAHYAGLFLMGLANLLMIRVFIRTLGPEAYGLFALGIALVGLLQILEFGISGAVVKYVAEWRAQQRWEFLETLWSTGMLLMLLFAGGGGLILILIAPHAAAWFHIGSEYAGASVAVLCLFGFSMVWMFPAMIAKGFLEGSQRYDLSNGAETAAVTINSVLCIYLILRGNGIVAVSIVQVVCSLLYYILLMGIVRREFPGLKFRVSSISRSVLSHIRAWSLWNLVRNVASRISWDLDTFLIGILLSTQQISPYVLGRKLPYMYSAVSWRWVEVFLPLSSHLEAEGKKAELTSIFLQASRYCLAISLCGAIPLMVFARPLLALWLGAVSRETIVVQQLVTASLLLDLSHAVSATLLAGAGKIKRISIYFLVESILNVSLTVLLVREFGITGAALATLISSVFTVLFLQIPFGCKVFSVSAVQYFRFVLRPQVFPTLATAMAAILFTQILPSGVGVIVALGVAILIYVLVFWMTGLNAAERLNAKHRVRNFYANLH